MMDSGTGRLPADLVALIEGMALELLGLSPAFHHKVNTIAKAQGWRVRVPVQADDQTASECPRWRPCSHPCAMFSAGRSSTNTEGLVKPRRKAQ